MAQAEKSARVEAETRCAAALEALRQVGGHPSLAAPCAADSARLPDGVIRRARESITAACGLMAFFCTILEGKPLAFAVGSHDTPDLCCFIETTHPPPSNKTSDIVACVLNSYLYLVVCPPCRACLPSSVEDVGLLTVNLDTSLLLLLQRLME